MARPKQYADRVNELSWAPSGPSPRSNVTAASSGIKSGSPAVRSAILKAAATWNDTRRGDIAGTSPAFEDLLQAARSKSIELNARKAGILLEAPQASPAPQAARLALARIRCHASSRASSLARFR
jgi:hypothetical protein